MNRNRWALLSTAVSLVVAVGCGTANSSAAAGPGDQPAANNAAAEAPNVDLSTASTHKRWVLGYYAMYQLSMMPVSEVPWNDLTHLVVTRVVPKANGSLDTGFDYDPTTGPQVAKSLATKARAHNVVPILMVGGAGTHDDFIAAVKSHQSSLITNLLNEMKKLNFAGLDLDIEPINQPDEAPFLKFVSALRAKAPGIVLTVPVGWTSTTFPTVDPFYGQLAQKVDRENVMAYSMADPTWGTDWRTWHSSALTGAGPHWPTAVDVSVKSYRDAGVPASKLGVGIGFYGSCWSGPATQPRQPVTGESITAADNVMTYATIMKNYYSASAYHYDTKAQASYLSFAQPHGSSKCRFLSYEDPKSIAAKARFIKSNGLGGVIIWTINQGHIAGASGSARDGLLANTAKDVA